MKNLFNKLILLSGLVSVMMTSCGDDGEDPVVIDPPFAAFTSENDEENNLMVTFINNSIDADTYSWDFGDGVGTSVEENPTYTYTASGTFTVTLTVTNAGGEDEATGTVTVSGFGPNLLANGDFESTGSWSELQLWTANDNAVGHGIENGTYAFKTGTYTDDSGNEQDTYWSNFALYQEVEIEAGSQYVFSADLSSTSGTNATWFEVYFVKDEPVNEDNIGGDATQLAIKSFGDGENCSASAFEGDILEIANQCTAVNSFDKNLDSDGFVSFTADELSSGGTIFLVFKAGSGFAADGEVATFGDGIIMDNVEIKKVL